jgi:hypothetical protein
MESREGLVHAKAADIEPLARRVVSTAERVGLLGDGWRMVYSFDYFEDMDSSYDGVVLRLGIVSAVHHAALTERLAPDTPWAIRSLGFDDDTGAQSVVVYNFNTSGLTQAKCTWNRSEIGNRSGTFLFYMQLYIALKLGVGATDSRVADFTLENMTDVPARAARPGGIYGLLEPDPRMEGSRAFVGADLEQRLRIAEGGMRWRLTGETILKLKNAVSGLGLPDDRDPWSDQMASKLRSLASVLFNQYSGGRRRTRARRRRARTRCSATRKRHRRRSKRRAS